MVILIEHGTHELANYGDIAMLQVTCERLQSRWPDACIKVVTRNPDRLRELLPAIRPVRAGRLESLLIKYITPVLAIPVLVFLCAIRRRSFPLWEAIQQASIVALSGGGYINQHFAGQAHHVLSVLHVAQMLRKPVWLFGQGFDSPLSGFLQRKAVRVLSRAEQICVRESLRSPALLQGLGVSSDRVRLTGDDAIALAYHQRPEELGRGIGLNIRIASYAKVDRALAQSVVAPVKAYSEQLSAPLVPFLIAYGVHDTDTMLSESLIGSRYISEQTHPGTPASVIQQIGTCRVVVTGSYHGAVFALSQGIPTICLAVSDYYINKFQGLSGCFGEGCTVIDAGLPDAVQQIAQAIDHHWQYAMAYRSSLLERARLQIEQSRTAYDSVSLAHLGVVSYG